MFNLFKKNEPLRPAVEPPAPDTSARDTIRTKMDDAISQLDKISSVVADEKAVRKTLQDELNVLQTRAAGLKDAISYGMAGVSAGAYSEAQMETLISRAKNELAENLSLQAPLNLKISTINSFLESVEEQRLALAENVERMNVKLSALEVREMSVNVTRSINEVEGKFDDYRRHVYTYEAHAELSAGKL